MGILDLPGPVYGWIDASILGFLPPLARIVLWGLIGAAISMGLYAAMAPQARIAEGKREIAATRRALDTHEDEFSKARPLIDRLLRLSLAQVRMTSLPAIVASLPLLTMLAWMSTAYGHSFPAPGNTAAVRVSPASLEAEWVGPASPEDAPRVLVSDGNGHRITRLSLPVPVNVVHQRQWWNVLLGNPAGYLPGNGAVEAVRMDLPRQQHLSFGPYWLRGWEAPFFTVLLLASLALKVGARIQ